MADYGSNRARQEVFAMKQFTLFAGDESEEKKYSVKIEAPIYEPTGPKPHLLTIYDDSKTRKLCAEIEASDIPHDVKSFLKIAAQRHTVFNYELIAEYYAHAEPEIQKLMENSALVIIDFDKAVENGFVRLCDEIRTQFLEEYKDEQVT
jgi:hypothetical protein